MTDDPKRLHLQSVELWGRCRRTRAKSQALIAHSENLIALSRDLLLDVAAVRDRVQRARDNGAIAGGSDGLSLCDRAAVYRDGRNHALLAKAKSARARSGVTKTLAKAARAQSGLSKTLAETARTQAGVSKRKAKLLRRQRAGLCVFAAETVGVAHKLHPRHAGATEPKFVRQWRAWARYGGPLPKSDA